jgi:hypothetical protein
MKTQLGTLTATLALAAAIAAGPASAAAPSVTAATGAEGTVIAVPLSHTCKVKKGCTYDVRTVNGTAVTGTDYVAAETAGFARKKKDFATTLTVQTLKDTACEPAETLTVHVAITNKKGVFGFDATQTITDKDCKTPAPAPPAQPGQPAPPSQPAPAPAPKPPVTIPANPPGADVMEGGDPNSATMQCRGPKTAGTPSPTGKGFRAPACYVWETCPTSVAECTASVSWEMDSEGSPFYVNGWGNARVYDSLGNELDHQAKYCEGFGSCFSTQDAIRVQRGQTIVSDCSGYFDPTRLPPEQDRALDPTVRANCVVSLSW